MESELGGSTNRSSSFSSNNTTGFECNICFDLAQDPIVTLCGHLFCWPCLYQWLNMHSRLKDCPVCKAVVEEDKLVPLYGRGKSSSDPRSKSIPHRPAGQRPQTAPPPEPNLFHHPHHHGFGFMGSSGGLAGPMASARFGNFTFSAALGGLIPSLLNHQFNDPANFGFVGGGFPHRLSNPFHGLNLHRQFHHHHHHQPRHAGQRNQQDYVLKRLLVIILVFVFVALILQ